MSSTNDLRCREQSNPVGFLSCVCQAAIEQTRKFFDSATLELYGMRDMRVSMEYPLTNEEYPCIQIDFTPKSIKPQNLAGGSVDWQDDIRVFIFEGVINFYCYAMTHLESDTMSDGLISMIMGDDSFKRMMHSNKYSPMDVNVDNLTIGPRSVMMGTSWDDDQFVYYTAYSIPCIGQFAYQRKGAQTSLIEHVMVKMDAKNNNWGAIDSDSVTIPAVIPNEN